jgi:hypothetical protein
MYLSSLGHQLEAVLNQKGVQNGCSAILRWFTLAIVDGAHDRTMSGPNFIVPHLNAAFSTTRSEQTHVRKESDLGQIPVLVGVCEELLDVFIEKGRCHCVR